MASPVTTTSGACTAWAWAVLSCLAIRSRTEIAKRTSRQWFWSDRKCVEQRRVQPEFVSMEAEITDS